MNQTSRTRVKEIFLEAFERTGADVLHLHPDQMEIIIDEATEHINEVWPEYQNKEISRDELLIKRNVFAGYLANMIKEFGEKGGD